MVSYLLYWIKLIKFKLNSVIQNNLYDLNDVSNILNPIFLRGFEVIQFFFNILFLYSICEQLLYNLN